MDYQKLIEFIILLSPSVIIAIVGYFLFKKYTENEQIQMKHRLFLANKQQALPIKLQAYERMVLFLERINPSNLFVRITPFSNDKVAYQQALITTIEQEFEHNLAQQIYVSADCWNNIKTAKNATIQLIKEVVLKEDIATAHQVSEMILTNMMQKPAPSALVIAFIKEELKALY